MLGGFSVTKGSMAPDYKDLISHSVLRNDVKLPPNSLERKGYARSQCGLWCCPFRGGAGCWCNGNGAHLGYSGACHHRGGKVEDRNNRAKRAYRAWSHFVKRGRTKDVAHNHGNDHNDCPHNDDNNQNRTCLTDTAPFNVPAFLNYLDQRDHNFDSPYHYTIDPDGTVHDHTNDGTHYYGDDCPGGHNND